MHPPHRLNVYSKQKKTLHRGPLHPGKHPAQSSTPHLLVSLCAAIVFVKLSKYILNKLGINFLAAVKRV